MLRLQPPKVRLSLDLSWSHSQTLNQYNLNTCNVLTIPLKNNKSFTKCHEIPFMETKILEIWWVTQTISLLYLFKTTFTFLVVALCKLSRPPNALVSPCLARFAKFKSCQIKRIRRLLHFWKFKTKNCFFERPLEAKAARKIEA